ncbi:hypothetical protein HS088_TW09G01113 [Tripterygium wilfordii]|uniref:GATA-type domain-containing protein n=1 Tax=Tripterygium wilfordii TaxID=458696 RepID=A0A7J7D9S4_TRIWF|nr:GATA transcription factor 21-like [Tripterygium wilfordii]KAF5743051.1 hypothetical protein HS088_TW09G01113 [Tripterygium wilfordii]
MTSTNFHSPSTSFPLGLHEEDHQHLFYLKPQASSLSSSSSCPLSNSILFNSNQEQGEPCYYRESQQIQHQGNIFVSHNGSCDRPSMLKTENTNSDNKLCIDWKNDDGNGNGNGNPSESSSSVKWMSSKMRLMEKMMNSNQIVVTDHSTHSSETQKHRSTTSQTDNHKEINNPYINSNNAIRVCTDCNTTKTPLWRSGPTGPKSLCNACGIRQRKARRAMAKPANGAVETPPPLTTSMKKSTDHKVKNKNKRSSDESYSTLPIKKRYKLTSQPSRGRKKICFEDLQMILSKNSTAYQQVFPQDEKEAAILLMALSYGLIRG